MKRSIALMLAVVFMTLLPSIALAKDAARKIPIHAYVMGSTITSPDGGVNDRYTYVGPADMSLIAREVEFANRAYGDANIRFTFAGRPDTEYVLWGDLNCWSDKETNPSDIENAEWLASFYPDMLSSIFTSFRTEINGIECIPIHCGGSPVACSACNGGNCAGTDVGCYTYPWDPVPYCMSNANFCGMPSCLDPNSNCAPVPGGCGFTNTQVVFDACMFNVKDPVGEGLGTMAHEYGHHFGLAHTFQPYSGTGGRCYDYGKNDAHPNYCGAEPEPNCAGTAGYCLGSTYVPWKNLMSYHGRCNNRHGGTYHGSPSEWNSTLTEDQINIIWMTLNQYYDRQLTSSTDDPPIQYGASEPIFLTQDQPSDPAHPTSAAKGYDRWDQLWLAGTGNSMWTRPLVSIVQGDFNADGFLDAIVTATSGGQPGTSFFKGGDSQGRLTFVRQLMSGTTPSTSEVLVGNFRGDRSDDVLIRTSAGAWEYEGLASDTGSDGGPSPPASASRGWDTSSTKVVLGDFFGNFQTPVPLASYLASSTNSTSHQSYVDAIVLYNTSGVYLYPGTATGLLLGGGQYLGNNTNYPMSSRVWAADLWNDHHHEFVVQGPNGFEIFKGVTTGFSLATGNRLYNLSSTAIPQAAVVNLAIGNFSYDYKADYVMTASGTSGYNGSKLYSGSLNYAPTWYTGDWYRSDLTPNVVKYVVGDLTRGAFDDLMLITTMGSFLYAGQPASQGGNRTLAENVWTNWTQQFSSNQARWSGR